MGSLLSTSKADPGWKSEAQFAMESSCFCVICGSPFDLEGEVYNLDAGAARYKVNMALRRLFTVADALQWMRNYRLIGSKQDVHRHNLENLSEEDFQCVPCYWRSCFY